MGEIEKSWSQITSNIGVIDEIAFQTNLLALNAGVEAAHTGETGRALGESVEKVGQINGLISEIAQSSKERATGLSEVNVAVNQMDQATQQNAAMVEETMAASASLKSEASELRRMVDRFNVSATPSANIAPSQRPGAIQKHPPDCTLASPRLGSASARSLG